MWKGAADNLKNKPNIINKRPKTNRSEKLNVKAEKLPIDSYKSKFNTIFVNDSKFVVPVKP